MISDGFTLSKQLLDLSCRSRLLFNICNTRHAPSQIRIRLFSSSRCTNFPPELTNVYNGKKTFSKILIANRGEIACRIMKTCKKMGIKTVAVYSEPDANGVHVSMADEAVCIGPAKSADSYLRMDKILDAVKSTGAQAVHPGYGFLSENPKFVKLLEDNDIAFIGPSHHPMELLGEKLSSKQVARAAGVNTIPGFKGEIRDDVHAVEVANQIGYPVMIKASSGGGGKGMRISWNDAETKEGFRFSKAEAKSSFGSEKILIEKYIENPRHIEIQLMGDKHGNYVYLNERDCSIQRRNQKVIEEAPSPFVDEELRRKMGQQAVMLAKAVGYFSAGTIECMVDANKDFYFLEMNTRLQVEHPVSELISGVDLVELMIDVAAGHPLSITQDDVKPQGWAIECRVYAENPKNFLPCTGRLSTYKEPVVGPREGGLVRIDSGIIEGSLISIYYDPMISKLIVHAKDRPTAIKLMSDALDEYVIKGLVHNLPILSEMINHPEFANGECTTAFIGKHYKGGFLGHVLTKKELNQLLASACFMKVAKEYRAYEYLDSKKADYKVDPKVPSEYVIHLNGERHTVSPSVEEEVNDYDFYSKVKINGKIVEFEDISWKIESPILRGKLAKSDSSFTVQYLGTKGNSYLLQHCGTVYSLEILDAVQESLKKYMPIKKQIDLSKVVQSPMPGCVFSVAVKVGDVVAEGAEIAVVEAMKMQNSLKSKRDGIVKAIHFKAGDTVHLDDIIVEFDPIPKLEEK